MTGLKGALPAKFAAWSLIIASAVTVPFYGILVYTSLTMDSDLPARHIDGWVRAASAGVFLVPLLMICVIWQLVVMVAKLSVLVPDDEPATPVTEGE